MISTPSRYLSLFVFLLLATPLLAGFLMPESAQEILKERRTRAPAPSLPRSMQELAAWPKEAEDYLGDRFGLRKQMIRLHANLAKRWLGEGSELVLVGRHGRLFFLGDVSIQQSAGLVRRESRVTETADFLAAMRDVLAQRGARFLVASPPNAATIYQDDLPRWARSNGRTTEYDIFLADLAARGIKVVDLRPAVWVARSKGPAYFRYDTHWTPRGAIAAFNAIADAGGHPDWRVEANTALAPRTRRRRSRRHDQRRRRRRRTFRTAGSSARSFSAGIKGRPDRRSIPNLCDDQRQPGRTIMIIGNCSQCNISRRCC